MKILLDESLPRKLRNDFGESHEVFSVRDMGWLGKKNGELLQLILNEGFDLFVTVDRNLRYQENLKKLPVTIAVLCAFDNRREALRSLLPSLFLRLEAGDLPNVVEIYQ